MDDPLHAESMKKAAGTGIVVSYASFMAILSHAPFLDVMLFLKAHGVCPSQIAALCVCPSNSCVTKSLRRVSSLDLPVKGEECIVFPMCPASAT